MTLPKASLLFAVSALALVACGSGQDVILPGERLDIRTDLSATADESVETVEEAPAPRALSLPAPQSNSNWTHRNGGPDHRLSHPALPGALTMAFQVNIGEGDSRQARITADPVVSDGRVFTLDARSTVSAVSTAGAVLWSRDLAPLRDQREDASGGGLAVAGEQLFVTTGFGEVTALDVESGEVQWVQDVDAPGGSAPTVVNDLVYVVSRDSRAWAISAATGRVEWTIGGTPDLANFSGGAGAAVTEDIAIFPFPSGEVLAAFPQGGLRRWSGVVTGQRLGQSAGVISDISGDPVIDGNRVYVANISGRVAALNVNNGDRLWTAVEGAVSPVWPEGDSLFLVNDLSELVRLDADDGSVIWRVALPVGEQRERQRLARGRLAHYGPVLAGGRLIVASSDGQVRQFDPESGEALSPLTMPAGATTNPVVAGETLYLVTASGQLVAFR